MGMFSKGGTNPVKRFVQVRRPTAAVVVPIPAGAKVLRVYAQNRTATGSNISVGSSAAGEQYIASTAIPTGTPAAPGYLSEPALNVAVSAVNSNVHVTLSNYAGGGVSVVVEYIELGESLPLPTQQLPPAY